MPTFKYTKLVRDKTYDRTISSGGSAVKKNLTKKDHVFALKEKLIEEALEVKKTINPVDLVEELADITEVIYCLSMISNISMEDIENKRLSKKKERGGFENGLYIESASFPENHKLTKYCRKDPEKYPEVKQYPLNRS